MTTNKRKIINDPLYGFINITSDLIFDLIEHPWFQRLRRIKQLGLTNYVYPGANHTRFQHALGSMYLIGEALNTLRSKGHEITSEEAEAVSIAILLHDIGHGPFSHALEFTLIESHNHERLSLALMKELNKQFNGSLELAISIFVNQYHKSFLHQLVSGQLDMDRLDYLKRDSFFTGVTEGAIGSDRIISMLNVVNDQLVVDYKGIYSVEKFLIARRLMYWQVYLHKTVLSAENLLIKLLERAKYLTRMGSELFATPALQFFLQQSQSNQTNKSGIDQNEEILHWFTMLDDSDIMVSIKNWTQNQDFVLSYLSKSMIERRLFKIILQNQPFAEQEIQKIQIKAKTRFNIDNDSLDYLVFTNIVSNHAYLVNNENEIYLRYNNGSLCDISKSSDIINISALSKETRKYFICFPKELI